MDGIFSLITRITMFLDTMIKSIENPIELDDSHLNENKLINKLEIENTKHTYKHCYY